jgi:hypothetical protein
MNFTIKDESGMTATELEITRLVIIEYLKPLSPWNFGNSEITINGEGVPIYITKRNRHLGIKGFHTVSVEGNSEIYVVPTTERFGFFKAGKPMVPAVPARKVAGVSLRARPAVPARPDTIRGGQLSTICHEVIEVLGDPLLQTLADADSSGHQYLREIADPVAGQYYNKVINGINCILPNTCLPNWYKLGATPPYDVMGYCVAPFQRAPKGYAFWVDKLGKFIKV